jgi:GT2 family glycosyltransferase
MNAFKLSITIVTYNSARYIRQCLESVLRQRGVSLEIIVVDNASTDDTLPILDEFKASLRLLRNQVNTGFAAAQNQAIAAARGEWVLTLNPDVLLLPGFLPALIEAGESDPRTGSVCGKLFSIGPGFTPLPERRLDSTGMYFTPSMRHFDRGWGENDHGQYNRGEYVFGPSAAAALYRRSMIADVAVGGAFFDPDFFCYREDADVAWRAQLLGWRSIYTPRATAYHVRSVVPENRRHVPRTLNMHSVKNRFLMRVKNATPDLLRRYFWPMLWRDLVVVGGVLLTEPGSLPAFAKLLGCLPRALRQRRAILSRQRSRDAQMAAWFASAPVAAPLPAVRVRRQKAATAL